jgi:NADPH:quinone reductase-like Zn-dependent oxidoreductase
LSFRIRKQARQRHVAYAFLFMKANGAQLQKLTQLIESGVIRPVLDKVFPLTATNDALRYVESGRAKGKVVIKVL